MTNFVRMSAGDNIIVASRTLNKGDVVENVTLVEPVIVGHKISTEPISMGARILKYGQTIGHAESFILPLFQTPP